MQIRSLILISLIQEGDELVIVMNNRVLIIGFGRIGQMKAKQWESLNCDVYVYDTDIKTLGEARRSGYQVVNNLNQEIEYLDICVPTALHATYIMDERITVLKNIVVEKPIVSNSTDWALLNDFAHKFPDKISKIIVSEQYYYSNALNYVKNVIEKNEIISIGIKMNKDRTLDNLNGRFIDRDLHAYGIEFPHILAVLDLFNIDFSKINSEFENDFFFNVIEAESGCTLEGSVGQIHYYLESFLGMYIYSSQQDTPHNKVDREVVIQTKKESYIVKFDPVKGLDRYRSMIISKDSEFTLEDNMLGNMISRIINGQPESNCNFYNAMNLACVLMNLKSNAQHHNIALN